MQSSAAKQVKAWYSQYGSILKSFIADFGALEGNLDPNNPPEVIRAAQKLQDDAATLMDYPPIPIPQAAAELSVAMSSCATMAQYCIDGFLNNDQALIDRATDEIHNCSAHLAQAIARVNEVMGQ